MQIFEFFAFFGLFLFSMSTVMVFSQLRDKWNAKLKAFGWYFFVAGTISLFISSLYAHLQPEFSAQSIYLVTGAAILICVLSGAFKSSVLALGGAPFISMILLGVFFSTPNFQTPSPDSGPILHIHVLFSILGSCLSIGAGVIALVYLLQNRALKRGGISNLLPGIPSLEKLERLLSLLLWIALTFITLSLITGAYYTRHNVDILTSGIKLKITWSIAVFIWFSFIFILQTLKKLSTGTVAKLALIGLCILSMALFGLWFGPLR